MNNIEDRTVDFVKVAGTHIDAMLLRRRTAVEGLIVIRREFLPLCRLDRFVARVQLLSSDPMSNKGPLAPSPSFDDVNAWMTQVWGAGIGRLVEPGDLAVHPNGTQVAFTGIIRDGLDGPNRERVGVLDLGKNRVEPLGDSPGDEHFARWSPTGQLAFLADRNSDGAFGLWISAGPGTGSRPGPVVPGTIERICWDSTGTRIAAVCARGDADRSGETGSGQVTASVAASRSWVPSVASEKSEGPSRQLWLIDVSANTARVVSGTVNVWDAEWVDEQRLVVVATDQSSESDWYEADLKLVDLHTGTVESLCRPSRQVQLMPTPPGGRSVAFIEALASDRESVAGDLMLADVVDGRLRRVDAAEIDVTSVSWRPDGRAIVAGHRRLETVVVEIDPRGRSTEVWASDETIGHPYPAAFPLPGDAVVAVRESWARPPEIVVAGPGGLRVVACFGHEGTEMLAAVGGLPEAIGWRSTDELEVEGWLITDAGRPPRGPLLLEIHGGPVWLARNRWSARNIVLPLLVSRGFSVLQPNFRGSIGRGGVFRDAILGDIGGLDIDDCLTGVDAVVRAGRADPARLGILGGSHGGFATSMAITRDHRFGAAVALSPVTDWWSQHGTSNIGQFDRLFLEADANATTGPYIERSPARHADTVRTPLLLVAGAVDHCTPVGQAQLMHAGLVDAGRVDSDLVVYPEEGHGVRSYPAVTDYCARVVAWFETYLTSS